MDIVDEREFEALVRAHGTMLVRLGAALTADPGIGEEVAQSALERVYVRWSRLDDPLAYARQVVVNLCRDRGRGVLRRERVGLPVSDLAAPDAIGERDDRDELVRAVRGLPYRQRTVVVLRFWLDMTEQQAADALGVGVGTVKSQTSRAVRRLRQVLDTESARSFGGRP